MKTFFISNIKEGIELDFSLSFIFKKPFLQLNS